jgi:dedicator of cytokinesis protein 3
MLGTAIHGAIESPVSGGVVLYRDTFLDEAFSDKHPELGQDLADLRVTLGEHVAAVGEALRVHARLCKDMAFHEALKSRESSALRHCSRSSVLPRIPR